MDLQDSTKKVWTQAMFVLDLWVDIVMLPCLVALHVFQSVVAATYSFFMVGSPQRSELEFSPSTNILIESLQHMLESGKQSPPSETRETPHLPPSHFFNEDPLPSPPTASRRPRPASYHGRTHHTTSTLHSRTHSGGIIPLQLPLKVASAQSSPRLNGDVRLPPVNEETQSGRSTPRTSSFHHSNSVGRDPPSAGRSVSFALDLTQPLERLQSTHQAEANDAYAQQERESLLSRIAQLENALMDHQRRPHPVEAHEQTVNTDGRSASFQDDESPYPSPPGSPHLSDNRPKAIHERVLLQQGGFYDSTPVVITKPPLIVFTSPALLFEASDEGAMESLEMKKSESPI